MHEALDYYRELEKGPYVRKFKKPVNNLVRVRQLPFTVKVTASDVNIPFLIIPGNKKRLYFSVSWNDDIPNGEAFVGSINFGRPFPTKMPIGQAGIAFGIPINGNAHYQLNWFQGFTLIGGSTVQEDIYGIFFSPRTFPIQLIGYEAVQDFTQ